MSDTSIADRMKAHGLKLPEAELPKFEEFVKDLDRAAAFVRSVERPYSEEPGNVFRLAPGRLAP